MSDDDDDHVRRAAARLPALRPHLGELEVLSVARNGARLDAELGAGERRWWLVQAADEEPIAFERPPLAPPTPEPGGVVVVLNGVSSAGKSSVVRAIVDGGAGAGTEPWIGFDEPFFGLVRPEVLIWPEQAPALWRGFLAGIAALAAEGNRVIAASGGLPFADWRRALHASRCITVAIDCPTEVLVERHRLRADRRGDLIDSTTVHDGWAYDRRFDSSVTSTAGIAEAIAALVAERS